MMVILGVIRRNKPAIKIKVIIIYVLLCSLCLASQAFLDLPGNLLIRTGTFIAQVIYLIFGIIHVNLLKYFKKAHRFSGNEYFV